jgi:anti-anti-sigma regulatory factor
MKLKMEKRDDVQVLVVTEALGLPQALVLRAGLSKMLRTGVKQLVVDLTGATPLDPKALEQLGDARNEADTADVTLVFVAADPEWADAPTTDAAIQRLKSPLGDLLTEEAKLHAQLKKLQRRKHALETRLGADGGQDTKTLRKENSDLKNSVTWLENVVEAMVKARKEPAFIASTEKKMERLKEILAAILEQVGLLPLK